MRVLSVILSFVVFITSAPVAIAAPRATQMPSARNMSAANAAHAHQNHNHVHHKNVTGSIWGEAGGNSFSNASGGSTSAKSWGNSLVFGQVGNNFGSSVHTAKSSGHSTSGYSEASSGTHSYLHLESKTTIQPKEEHPHEPVYCETIWAKDFTNDANVVTGDDGSVTMYGGRTLEYTFNAEKEANYSIRLSTAQLTRLDVPPGYPGFNFKIFVDGEEVADEFFSATREFVVSDFVELGCLKKGEHTLTIQWVNDVNIENDQWEVIYDSNATLKDIEIYKAPKKKHGSHGSNTIKVNERHGESGGSAWTASSTSQNGSTNGLSAGHSSIVLNGNTKHTIAQAHSHNGGKATAQGVWGHSNTAVSDYSTAWLKASPKQGAGDAYGETHTEANGGSTNAKSHNSTGVFFQLGRGAKTITASDFNHTKATAATVINHSSTWSASASSASAQLKHDFWSWWKK